MSKKLSTTLFVLCLSIWTGNAKALLNFEVVNWGSNFVAFTVSGDFSGYADPPTSSALFSIVYDGDLWVGPNTSTGNTWTPGSGPFTVIQVVNPGSTVFANATGFSFIQYSDRLSNGALILPNNQPIILQFAPRLNTSATNPVFHFVWGSGGLEHTIIDTWPDIAPVPDLTLNKFADVSTYSAVGDVINYSYQVVSSGTGPVVGPITVADDKVTVTCPAVSTVGNNDANLDPSEILICTASHVVVQADIDAASLTNTATASGDAGATVSDLDIVTVTYQAPITYSVNVSVEAGNGTVSCDPAIVQAGDSSTCTAVPDAGWQVSGWTGACATVGTSETCTLENIQADQTLGVSFEASAVTPVEITPVPTISRLGLIILGLLIVFAAAIRYRW